MTLPLDVWIMVTSYLLDATEVGLVACALNMSALILLPHPLSFMKHDIILRALGYRNKQLFESMIGCGYEQTFYDKLWYVGTNNTIAPNLHFITMTKHRKGMWYDTLIYASARRGWLDAIKWFYYEGCALPKHLTWDAVRSGNLEFFLSDFLKCFLAGAPYI
jgi:hypothetical protein